MSRHGIPHSCPSIDKAIKELEDAKDELVDILRGLDTLARDDVPVADLKWSAEYAQDRIADAIDHFEEVRRINGDLRDKLEEALDDLDAERAEVGA